MLLARPPCAVLATLGRALQFEIAVGQNGRAWVNAPTTGATVLVASAVQASEGLTPQQQEHVVRQLLRVPGAAGWTDAAVGRGGGGD